jgi:serine/threonine-protein kinase HipA
LLYRGEAEKIVKRHEAEVDAAWYNTVHAIDVSEKDAETIRGAFVYSGFSL